MAEYITKSEFDRYKQFVSTELPKRISTKSSFNASGNISKGQVPITTGIGYQTEFVEAEDIVSQGISFHNNGTDSHPDIRVDLNDLLTQFTEKYEPIYNDLNEHRFIIDYKKHRYNVKGGDLWIHSNPDLTLKNFNIGLNSCHIDNEAKIIFLQVSENTSLKQKISYESNFDDSNAYIHIVSYGQKIIEYNSLVEEKIKLADIPYEQREYLEGSVIYTYYPEQSNFVDVSMNLGLIEGDINEESKFKLEDYDPDTNGFNRIKINTSLDPSSVIRITYYNQQDINFTDSDYLIENQIDSNGYFNFKGWINHSKIYFKYNSPINNTYNYTIEYDLWITDSSLPIVWAKYDNVQNNIYWDNIPQRDTWLNRDSHGRIDPNTGEVYTFGGKSKFNTTLYIMKTPTDSEISAGKTCIEYYGDAGIRVRGSSSQNYPKRQYNIYLRGDTMWVDKTDQDGNIISLKGSYEPADYITRQFPEESKSKIEKLVNSDVKDIKKRNETRKVDLFDMGQSDRWVLHGCWFDSTLIKNKVSYDLFQAAGDFNNKLTKFDREEELKELAFGNSFEGSNFRSPRNVFVEFYNNNNYWGIHNLGEKIDHKRLRLQRDGYEDNDTAEIANPFYLSLPAQKHNFCNDTEDWIYYDIDPTKNDMGKVKYYVKVSDIKNKADVRVQVYLVPENSISSFIYYDNLERVNTNITGTTRAKWEVFDTNNNNIQHKITNSALGYKRKDYINVIYPLRKDGTYYYSKYGDEDIKLYIDTENIDYNISSNDKYRLYIRIREDGKVDDDKEYKVNIKALISNSFSYTIGEDGGEDGGSSEKITKNFTAERVFVNQKREKFDLQNNDEDFAWFITDTKKEYRAYFKNSDRDNYYIPLIYDYDKLINNNTTLDTVPWETCCPNNIKYYYKDDSDNWVKYDNWYTGEELNYLDRNVRIKFEPEEKNKKYLVHIITNKDYGNNKSFNNI